MSFFCPTREFESTPQRNVERMQSHLYRNYSFSFYITQSLHSFVFRPKRKSKGDPSEVKQAGQRLSTHPDFSPISFQRATEQARHIDPISELTHSWKYFGTKK